MIGYRVDAIDTGDAVDRGVHNTMDDIENLTPEFEFERGCVRLLQ